MHCAFCGVDPDHFTLVYQKDACEQVTACVDCARKDGAWCSRHDKAHILIQGGGGQGTICLDCFWGGVTLYRPHADTLFYRLMDGVPEAELNRVREWVTDMRSVWQEDAPGVVLRGIMMEAFRRRLLPEQIVADCLAAQSVSAILPLAY